MILFCCASELGLPEDLSAIEVILLLLLLPLSLVIRFVHSGCWPVVKYCSVSMIISL